VDASIINARSHCSDRRRAAVAGLGDAEREGGAMVMVDGRRRGFDYRTI